MKILPTLDLDYNDLYEDQSCNYRYQVLLYIGMEALLRKLVTSTECVQMKICESV